MSSFTSSGVFLALCRVMISPNKRPLVPSAHFLKKACPVNRPQTPENACPWFLARMQEELCLDFGPTCWRVMRFSCILLPNLLLGWSTWGWQFPLSLNTAAVIMFSAFFGFAAVKRRLQQVAQSGSAAGSFQADCQRHSIVRDGEFLLCKSCAPQAA